MKRYLACLPAALLAFALLCVQAAAAPIHLKAYRSLVKFASPRFSPDGTRIAFLTIKPDFVHDRYATTLRVVDTRGGAPEALVRGMRDLQMPRWSPDGRTLAFIAKVAKQKAEIYTIPASGGTPRCISDARNGVEQFAWSPDGKTIAFVTPDNPRVSAKAKRAHHDLFSIHDDDYQITHAPAPSHIWLLSVKDGAARQLTHGPTSVLENPPPFAGSITAPAWSADGKWLVFTRQIDADDSDTDKTTIAAVNVATGAVHAVTAHHTYEYTPAFAPQGDAIAYLYPHGPGPVSDMDVFVTTIAGGHERDVSADIDRDVYSEYAWLPDARGLVAVVNDHVGTRIFVQPLHGAAHALALGSLNPSLVAVSAQGALAFVADSATRAPELYLLRALSSQPVALTSFNRAFSDYAYPRSIEVTWHAPDGQPDDGILTYPNDYRAGQRYPLVVYSHGGPEAASTEHFDGGEIGPLRDVFAARGYLVFEPNYRGSDNLGDAHEHAIYRDPGVGPNSDVISGITMLEKQG
ncbi:MAG: prolyl oligopeptidase family serine peptidase, partial [Metallibacterium sp.]